MPLRMYKSYAHTHIQCNIYSQCAVNNNKNNNNNNNLYSLHERHNDLHNDL